MPPTVGHKRFPLRLDIDGSFAAAEQDTVEDVQSCVHVLLVTPLGARPLAPTIGVDDPTFTEGVVPGQLEATLLDQEPRAALSITAEPIGATGEQTVRIEVGLADDDAQEAP